MPFPSNDADLRSLVKVMRELGVVCAFGVELGPPPQEPSPPPSPELAEAARAASRLNAARERVRELLGAVGGDELPTHVIDAFIERGSLDG